MPDLGSGGLLVGLPFSDCHTPRGGCPGLSCLDGIAPVGLHGTSRMPLLLYIGQAVDHLGRRPQAVLGCFQRVVIAKRAPFLCRVRASRSLKPTEGYRLRRA